MVRKIGKSIRNIFEKKEKNLRVASYTQQMQVLLENLPPDMTIEFLTSIRALGAPEAFEKVFAENPFLQMALLELLVPEESQDGDIYIPSMFLETVLTAKAAEHAYSHSGDIAFLDEAMIAWQHIVNHSSFVNTSTDFQVATLDSKGSIHLQRFEATEQQVDLDRALVCWQQATQFTFTSSPDLPSIHNRLGNGYSDRFQLIGQPSDLDEAISFYQKAVQLAPADSSHLSGFLNNLGNGYHDRFQLTGQPSDLDEAISSYQKAVRLTPTGSSHWPSFLNNLGNGFRDRYQLAGQIVDLDGAISSFQQAIQLAPASSPDLPKYLNSLGNGLRTRYQLAGQMVDLDEAISSFQQAIQLTPTNSPDLPTHLNSLGNGLSDCYQVTGQMVHLHEAISIYRQAIQMTPTDSPDSSILANLGNELRMRYHFSRHLNDLHEAIYFYGQAIQMTPTDSPDFPTHLNNMGNGLHDRYLLAGEPIDLQYSILAYEHAIQLAPDSPNLAGYLNNLGSAFKTRYLLFKEQEDLHKAISNYQQAIQLLPTYSPSLPRCLINLGNGLNERYQLTSQPTDLHLAISFFKQGVQSTANNSPDLPKYLESLGNGLSVRYQLTENITDLNEAIEHWQEAFAWYYARASIGDDSIAMARKATRFARNLMSGWVTLGKTTNALEIAERSKAITMRQLMSRNNRIPANLTQDAATTFITLIKEARDIQARQRHLFRQEPPLPNRDSELANLHKQYTSQITRIQALEANDHLFNLTPPDYATLLKFTQHYNLTLVYLHPLAEKTILIFVYPGGSSEQPDILSLDDVTKRDLDGLEVHYLNSVSGTDVDSISPFLDEAHNKDIFGWFTAYWLSLFANTEDASPEYRLHFIWREVLRDVLQILSSTLIEPLVNRLVELQAERVVLLPGGRLSLLPLHAVPIREDGKCLGDRFMVSYAPSGVFLAQALERSTRREAGQPRLTAIANPDGSLVFASDEVSAIARRFSSEQASVANGSQASSAWLRQHTSNADYVALSTHANFVFGDPGLSAFILAHPDRHTAPTHPNLSKLQNECEKLTLDQLWAGDLPLKPGCLVTASACETAQMSLGDTIDEGLGFPAGFLAAGAGTVIATFWSVEDFATALFMDKLYEGLLSPNNLSPAVAAQRATHWLRELTKAEVAARLKDELEPLLAEEKAGKWQRLDDETFAANYHRLTGLSNRLRSLERGPGKPFAHPFYWAAFGVHGAG